MPKFQIFFQCTYNTHMPLPMTLKGISQSFWLEHFNRVFYCAHILCRLCSKFSSTCAIYVCIGETSLEPNISESVCVCGVASSSVRLLAVFGKNRIAAYYARRNSRLEATPKRQPKGWGKNAAAKEMRNVCTPLWRRLAVVGVAFGLYVCWTRSKLALPFAQLINSWDYSLFLLEFRYVYATCYGINHN